MFKLGLYCALIFLLLNLSITAKNYNGAELYSKGSLKYGRFDVRMRVVCGSGIISSFFLYYNDSYLGGGPWGEIDMEIVGKHENAFQSNLITGTAASKKTSEELHDFDSLSQSYHTYSFEWTPEYIAWFFDGEEVRRSTGSQVTDCQKKEMSIRFNLWISDVVSWAGQFNQSILPVYQYINWVKYSSYTPGSGSDGTDFTPEWEDDFDTFNSTRWGKGDWTFDGNLVDFSPNNIVVRDGYCIICLTNAGATGFSGDVPKDLTTPVLHGKSETGRRISITPFPNLASHFSVSLDGRLLSRKSRPFNRKAANFWIMRENNNGMMKIIILE
ncbi:MAG: family 16 glycosylhydrolase [Chitinispirillaceae bacterium]|nr:family 16 glycosylhydrolase [Chitinispirillaceae bacterium]